MPDLVQLLESQDAGFLRIVAGLWGLDLKSTDPKAGAEEVAAGMLEPQLTKEIIDTLEASARAALVALLHSGGRTPWASFVREFGDVREMGTGRRDREQPHQHPASAAEVLFYRGLMGRAFFDTERGPQEFAYVPDDLLAVVQKGSRSPAATPVPAGRPAAASDHASMVMATDRILDEATTLLAALRTGRRPPEDAILNGLLEAAGILQRGAPRAAKVKEFLETPRPEALRQLIAAWRVSATFNELRLTPGLICEGEWQNDPRAAREFILQQLKALPRQTWWSLGAFIADIKRRHPDFQRPAGDYDSWFIKSASDGSYQRGFASWDQVDGAMIQYLITDVMRRLGLVDLAGPEGSTDYPSFRLRSAPAGAAAKEDGKLHVTSTGRISAAPSVARVVRYQLARFCEWEDDRAGESKYRITPGSLDKAKEQGLRIEQLLQLLAKHADAGIPPALVKALKRWEANGTEARAETYAVLRVSKPEILKALRKSKAAKYLGEPLGPTAVIVKGGAMRKVAEAMTELGLLMEDGTNESSG